MDAKTRSVETTDDYYIVKVEVTGVAILDGAVVPWTLATHTRCPKVYVSLEQLDLMFKEGEKLIDKAIKIHGSAVNAWADLFGYRAVQGGFTRALQ